MKKVLLVLMLLLISEKAQSQNKNFSVELAYPISLTDGVFSSNEIYNLKGIIGVNIKYRFTNNKTVNFGLSYTFDFLKENVGYEKDGSALYGNNLFHNVNFLSELNLKSIRALHPYLSVGYTLANLTSYNLVYDENNLVGKSSKSIVGHGLNFKTGALYDITNSIFIKTDYQYLKVYQANQVNGQSFSLLNLGAGYRF